MPIKVLVKLDHLDSVINDEQVRPVSFGKIQHLLKQAPVLRHVTAQCHAADQGILPYVLKIELSRGNVKFPVQAG